MLTVVTLLSAVAVSSVSASYPTRATLWPWLVSLYEQGDDHMCGGSLIRKEDPAVILTAAHCVEGITKKDVGAYRAKFGLDQYDWGEDITFTLKWKDVITHSGYNQDSHLNDIALIVLDGEAKHYAPILLNTEDECCTEDDKVRIVGYKLDGGHKNEHKDVYTDELEYVDTRYRPLEECESYFQMSDKEESDVHSAAKKQYVYDSMLCGYDQKFEGCQGDTGGPVINGKRNYMSTQVGIVSFGFGCEEGSHGVFTKVASYYDWIQAAQACLLIENTNGGDVDSDTHQLCNSLDRLESHAPQRSIAAVNGNVVSTIVAQTPWLMVGAAMFAALIFFGLLRLRQSKKILSGESAPLLSESAGLA